MYRFISVTIAVSVVWGESNGASFTPLGDLPGGNVASYAHGVSADGTVVVGYSVGASGNEAFRWTRANGMVGLGDLPGGHFNSFAFGVADDGTMVVGGGTSQNGTETFLWTSSNGMVGLGDLAGGGFESWGDDISADGSVIVGVGRSTSGQEAFRWTRDGGMVGLGDFAGGIFLSVSHDVSVDGSVVVGFGTRLAEGGYSRHEAFRWTNANGMVALGNLGGEYSYSSATGVSADGSVVVGESHGTLGYEAFWWTSEGGMLGLGDLAGGMFYSHAGGISDDGQVVFGHGFTDSGREAFLWTQASGMQRLFDVLVAAGATGLNDWTLTGVFDISADGQWVVGHGINPLGHDEAFLASIAPVPVPGAVWLFVSALGVLGWVRSRSAIELAAA